MAMYLLTLAPSTAMWDTSEYIAAAKVLGLGGGGTGKEMDRHLPPGREIVGAIAQHPTLGDPVAQSVSGVEFGARHPGKSLPGGGPSGAAD